MKIKLLLVFHLLLLLTSCTNLDKTCCQECLEQATQDPSGYDISIKACAEYELSKNCQNYFADTEMKVLECRN